MESEFGVKILNGVETRIEKRDINMVDFLAYEAWLESLELEGWNLKSIEFDGDHTFIKGKSRKIRYCLAEDKSLKPEYKEMFEDFGWKLVYKKYNEFLWAMEYKDERPEAFNNMEVLIDRNKKYIKSITAGATVLVIIVIATLFVYKDSSPLSRWSYCIALIAGQISYYIKNIKFIKVYNKNKDIINSYNARI